jgi:hypothetical protein
VIFVADSGISEYKLNLVAQPSAGGRNFNISIQLPETARSIFSNLGTVLGQTIEISEHLSQDTKLVVQFSTPVVGQ